MTRVGSNDHSRYRLRTRAHDGGTRRSCTRGRQTRCELYDLVRAHSSRRYLRERCLRRSEYAISARGRAGGIMKVLVDGEASFATHGTIKDGYPVPTTFTSKIVSDAETSGVTMVLDEGSVKELATGLLGFGHVSIYGSFV